MAERGIILDYEAFANVNYPNIAGSFPNRIYAVAQHFASNTLTVTWNYHYGSEEFFGHFRHRIPGGAWRQDTAGNSTIRQQGAVKPPARVCCGFVGPHALVGYRSCLWVDTVQLHRTEALEPRCGRWLYRDRDMDSMAGIDCAYAFPAMWRQSSLL